MAQPASQSTGLGIASMVTGIVSVFFCGIPFFGFMIAAPAFILGIVSLAKHHGGKGMAIAGVATSSFALFVNLIIGFFWIIGMAVSAS